MAIEYLTMKSQAIEINEININASTIQIMYNGL